jgi:hypothetical protein
MRESVGIMTIYSYSSDSFCIKMLHTQTGVITNQMRTNTLVNEYIVVSYHQKEDAKQYGAKWDPHKKSWYIPTYISDTNKKMLREKYGHQIQESALVLVGENREFGGSLLFVDLIPTSCWFTNVRRYVHPADWDKLRRHVYERVDNCCECCGVDTVAIGRRLDAHERWSYDLATYTQKLERLIALCVDCHEATHMGYAMSHDRGDVAKAHLSTIRGFSAEECEDHIAEAFKLVAMRNNIHWHLDLSLITNSGIRLIYPTTSTNATVTIEPERAIDTAARYTYARQIVSAGSMVFGCIRNLFARRPRTKDGCDMV